MKPKFEPYGVKAYRVFEVVKDKHTGAMLARSLFHGTDRSRTIPLNQWVSADIKQVRDGSGNNYYTSGFHVFFDIGAAYYFFNHSLKKHDNRFVVHCYVRGEVRLKSLRSHTWLAEQIYIHTEDLLRSTKRSKP
jgi:hypothetical protein